MRVVAGLDFGTLSTRVTLLDRERGRLGTALAGYPLHRKRADPDFATQSHVGQMDVAKNAGIELVQIDAETRLHQMRRELLWSHAACKLR